MTVAEKQKPKAGQRGARTQARQTRELTVEERAEREAANAKRAAAKGARLNSAQTGLRNSLIIARAAQGMEWKDIAKEAGISARQCQRVAEAARSVDSPVDESPMQLLEGIASGFARSIGDYERMAFAWADTNQSAALGAKKAADETRARLASLMAEVGKLPSNLELFRSEMAMQRIAEQMVGMMRAVAAGEKTPDEAVAFFRELVGQRARAQLVA